MKCSECDSTCAQCKGEAHMCTECPDMMTLKEDYTCKYDDEYYMVCDEGEYYDSMTSECESCSDGCYSCKDSTWCTYCETPFFLANMTASAYCVERCPDGQVPDLDTMVCIGNKFLFNYQSLQTVPLDVLTVLFLSPTGAWKVNV